MISEKKLSKRIKPMSLKNPINSLNPLEVGGGRSPQCVVGGRFVKNMLSAWNERLKETGTVSLGRKYDTI